MQIIFMPSKQALSKENSFGLAYKHNIDPSKKIKNFLTMSDDKS